MNVAAPSQAYDVSRAEKPAVGQEAASVPLVVDLDGTLIRTDLLVESLFAHVARDLPGLVGLARALARGKAALKARIAREADIEVQRLPYNEDVLELVRAARAEGRGVYLASASNERYVANVARHLGLFDGWFASNATRNLSGKAKADALIEAFGAGRFDYAGNDTADLAVWKAARRRIAIGARSKVCAALTALDPDAVFVSRSGDEVAAWRKLLRVHQWAKNALILVPLITAQKFGLIPILQALGAIICFSLAASSIYIVNDLVDIDADRQHPTKRKRPIAAGTISALDALLAVPILLGFSILGALAITPAFALALLAYIVVTTAYSFVLKRKMIVDVIALASLYTLRVVAGAAAISVFVSEWLLAFSMFTFTSLALIKRYVELTTLLDGNLPDPSNRNYQKTDLDVVAALAAAAGFNGITVFTLYISSPTVHGLYRHPLLLWLICPVLMYWFGRLIVMAHRRLITDDPVVFALHDRNSLIAVVLIGAILLAAI